MQDVLQAGACAPSMGPVMSTDPSRVAASAFDS